MSLWIYILSWVEIGSNPELFKYANQNSRACILSKYIWKIKIENNSLMMENAIEITFIILKDIQKIKNFLVHVQKLHIMKIELKL